MPVCSDKYVTSFVYSLSLLIIDFWPTNPQPISKRFFCSELVMGHKFFLLIYSCSWRQKSYLPNFRVIGESWNFRDIRPVDTHFYMIAIFRCWICVQQASKSLGTNFEVFLFLWRNFGFFFIQAYKGWSDNFFLDKKSGYTLQNLFCPRFSCLSGLQEKWDQKAKWEKLKKSV